MPRPSILMPGCSASPPAAVAKALNDAPGRIGSPITPPGASVRDYFLEWLDRDDYPFWSLWENTRSWWGIRELPNLLLLHFSELKAELPGTIRRIADFLDIPVDAARWPTIVEHCGFSWMKSHAAQVAPLAGVFWEGGPQTFIYKGTNDRWRDVLTAADCRLYERTALQQLGPDCAHWLATGGRLDRAAA
jgi:aryl sulfotransferase